MRFVNHCSIRVVAGDGGNGVVAFRREKFVPFGGPSGGDGGKGGDVVFETAEGLSSLQDVVYQRTISADRGDHGQGSDKYGRAGEDRLVKVPAGTQVFDDDTGELVADLVEHGQRVVVAQGGKGGRGNIHFATPFDRAPRRAEKGERGESRNLRLELKVMADVGLLGFPNAGKSTFVSSVSAAKPRIADYPFTTLVPTLGMVYVGGGPRMGGTSFVVADIPGLVPGASEGVGLGIEFLKHVERTRVILHLITLDHGDGREPLSDYRALRKELSTFSPELAERPEIVALTKADLPEVRELYPALAKKFQKLGKRLWLLSAVTREGLDELVIELHRAVRGLPTFSPATEPRVTSKTPPSGKVFSKNKEIAEPVAKGAFAKRTSAKKAIAKKPAPKKVISKKPAPKKVSSKKVIAKRPAPKKVIAKKAIAKKPAPKKAIAKKATTKKSAPKKAISKKAITKKSAPKKAIAKKAITKKSAPKKAIAKKAITKKSAPKKAIAKKAITKKSAPKKAIAKKPAPKKAPGRRR